MQKIPEQHTQPDRTSFPKGSDLLPVNGLVTIVEARDPNPDVSGIVDCVAGVAKHSVCHTPHVLFT